MKTNKRTFPSGLVPNWKLKIGKTHKDTNDDTNNDKESESSVETSLDVIGGLDDNDLAGQRPRPMPRFQRNLVRRNEVCPLEFLAVIL